MYKSAFSALGRALVTVFLSAVLFMVGTGVALAGEKSTGKRFDNTNVILVTLQCLRLDHMGIGGYKRDTTPNLDRISKS